MKCRQTFYVQPLFLENLAVYKIMWKHTVERDRPQMTIWRMRIACWINKAADGLCICNTYCFFHCSIGCKKTPQYFIITYSVCLVTHIHNAYTSRSTAHSNIIHCCLCSCVAITSCHYTRYDVTHNVHDSFINFLLNAFTFRNTCS